MKENLKLGGILLAIAATAALLLSCTYEATKDAIAAEANKEKIAAMQEILPEAEKFEDLKSDGSDANVISISKGVNGSEAVGYVVETQAKGYGGEIKMVTGISKDGKIEGIKVVSHSETPGIGAVCETEEFRDQYKDKKADKPLTLIKSGSAGDEQIAATSGATITSTGVIDGVNAAINYFDNNLKGGN